MDRNRERIRLPVQGPGGRFLTIRRFALWSFLALIAILAAGQVLVSGRGIREELLAAQKREIRRELELVSVHLRSLPYADPDSAAQAMAPLLGYPVTLLTPDGMIVGASSDLPFQIRGRTVSRESPDFRAALDGDVGFEERRGTGEVEIRLFAAIRARLGDRELIVQVAAPLTEIRRAVRDRTWQSLGLAIPAFLLAAFLTLLFGRLLIRPLHTISRRIVGLSAGGFSRRVPEAMPVRELAELAGAVNRATEELESRFEGLESERDEMQALIDCMGEAVLALTADGRVLRANQAAIDLLDFPRPVNLAPIGTLVRQPELRSLLEGAVVRPFSAREVAQGGRTLMVSSRSSRSGGVVVTFVDVTELRRLEAVRRDFVANASHELKTPLTAMRGFAETLLDDDPPEDLRREWLGSIRSNTLRLQHLVDDLLDLSRLESGGWIAKKETVELDDLARKIVAEFTPRAGKGGVALGTTGRVSVLGDPQGLNQILRNLVENAIRHTPRGGSVSLALRIEGKNASISVKDTGAGIPTSALPRIFERFYRVDPARSREEGGTGLGLAIVRHLVQAMGGQVWAESELGQGTAITFTVPAAPADGSGGGWDEAREEGGP